MKLIQITFALIAIGASGAIGAEKWRGLTVADELEPNGDCSGYKAGEYDYAREKLLNSLMVGMKGKIFSPYTRREFKKKGDVHVEHIMSRNQAHYSGLCRKGRAKDRSAFASDLCNLTLAGAGVNRAKGKCDAATWMPPENRCWFANRIVEVRLKYGLTIDRQEANSLEKVLSACASHQSSMDQTIKQHISPLEIWDSDGNGQISCSELKSHGVSTPITSSHAAYPFVKDGNCDGLVC